MTSSRRTSVNAASASPRAPRVPPVPTTTTTRSATRTSARRAAARPAVEQEDVEAESGVPPTQPRATPSPATAGKRRAAPKAKRHATPANGRATKRPKPSRAAVPADASPTPSDDDTEDVVVLPCPNDPGRAADDFLRRFAAGAVGTTVAGGPTVDLAGFQSPPPTSTTTAQLPHAANDQAQAIANLEATVQALTATVATLANAVAAQAAPAPQPFAANSHTIFNLPAPAMLSRTAPSGACVYPTNDPSHPAPATLPSNFFTRTTPSFEYPSTKIKGEYYPSPSHVLVAQRLYRAAHPADDTPVGASLRTGMAQHFREHSVAPSTLLKYRRAFRLWSSFCDLCGVDPHLQSAHESASINIISAFILSAQAQGLRGASIDGRLAGVRHFITAGGGDASVFGHAQIRMLIKGIRRFDSPSISKDPVPLSLLAACYARLDLHAQAHRMLWGVLCMAFFFLLRRSEIAARGREFQWFALRDDDVAVLSRDGQPTSDPATAHAVTIRLRGSKTNQSGKPVARLLSRSGHAYICPVLAALYMKTARGPMPPSSPIASYATSDRRTLAVSAASITKTLRDTAASMGLASKGFSSHSLRAGGATQMYRAGVNTLTIQFHGRWVSDAFKLYTRLTDDTAGCIASSMVEHGDGRPL